MATKQQVEALLDKNLTVGEIARRLGCDSGYVRATLARNDWNARVKHMRMTADEIAQQKRVAAARRAARDNYARERREEREAQQRAAPHALALLNALQHFVEVAPEPPERNCSCHLNPPCGDCTEYSALREAFAEARAVIAQAEGRS